MIKVSIQILSLLSVSHHSGHIQFEFAFVTKKLLLSNNINLSVLQGQTLSQSNREKTFEQFVEGGVKNQTFENFATFEFTYLILSYYYSRHVFKNTYFCIHNLVSNVLRQVRSRKIEKVKLRYLIFDGEFTLLLVTSNAMGDYDGA